MNEREENTEVDDALQVKCASCGGIMRYSPARQNLKCIYCGAEKELDKTPIQVVAYPIEEYGKEKDAAEQMQEVHEIKCGQCGAVTTIPDQVASMKCPFCGASLMLKEQQVNRSWTPDAILPFKIEEKTGREAYRKWLSGKWFAPSKLKKEVADPTTFKGVYVPYWAYDAHTETIYVGFRGKRVRKSVVKDGKRETESEIDWTPTTGRVSIDFENVLVPATQTLPSDIADVMTDWDLENCVAYRKEFVSGFVTELYAKDQVAGLENAHESMEKDIVEAVKKDIGGDRQRVTTKTIDYSDVRFKLFLLPLWISSFNYNGKNYLFAVNGRNGKVTGNYPHSTWKIVLVVVLILLLILLFACL